MKSQSGFTLIEVMASGILSTVIAGAILSILHLTNDQIKDGTSYLRLEERQGIAAEQIRKTARHAKGVMKSWEDLAQVTANPAAQPSGHLSEIRFFNDDNCFTTGYKIESGYLWEADAKGCNILAYRPFTIGADTVFVDPDPAVSYFEFLHNRGAIISHLRVILRVDTTTYVRPNDSEFVLCRNRKWPP